MRGKISGFETRLREKVPHLLDIDGDICHHVHNVVKKFCSHFGQFVEAFDDNVYRDFMFSADLREKLSDICQLLNVPYHVPAQIISHR